MKRFKFGQEDSLMLYGAIEAGGTKFVCAVGDSQYSILDRVSIPTTTPAETMEQVISFFEKYRNELSAVGIGSFGPIDVDTQSEKFGFITNTPKILWRDFDFVGTIKKEFNLPIYWTTDVNASAYGEYSFGDEDELTSLVYMTIGTGVGGGAIQNGEFIGGTSHPEMGHMIVLPHPNDSSEGICPSHDFCLEGVACGPAIENRAGTRAENLSADSKQWDIEAYYIAQAVYNITYILNPNMIILGGGVMKQPELIEKVRNKFKEFTGEYLGDLDLTNYIVLPKLGDDAAVKGCFKLAEKALNNQ